MQSRPEALGDVPQHRDELIPAEPRSRVRLPQAPLQALGHPEEHPVPARVAQGDELPSSHRHPCVLALSLHLGVE